MSSTQHNDTSSLRLPPMKEEETKKDSYYSSSSSALDVPVEDGDDADDDDSYEDESYCYESHDSLEDVEDKKGTSTTIHELPYQPPSFVPPLFNTDPIPCPICFTTADSGEAIQIPVCGHAFCLDCFQRHITAQIEQGTASAISCPQVIPSATTTTKKKDNVIPTKTQAQDASSNTGGGLQASLLPSTATMPFRTCGTLVERDTLGEILDEQAAAKLDRFRTDAFVLSHPNYHHCPTPDCPNVVFLQVDANHRGAAGAAFHTTGPPSTASTTTTPLPIIDCFQCKRVSCRLCGISPYHFQQTCQAAAAAVARERARLRTLQQIAQARQPTDPPVDRSRANEEARYGFEVDPAVFQLTREIGRSEDGMCASISNNADSNTTTLTAMAIQIKQCRRCGNGIELSKGCFKMKCRCGYRFCWNCGTENANCSCTPSNHGFIDNTTGRAEWEYAGPGSKSFT